MIKQRDKRNCLTWVSWWLLMPTLNVRPSGRSTPRKGWYAAKTIRTYNQKFLSADMLHWQLWGKNNLSYCMYYVLLTRSHMQLCHKNIKDSQQSPQCPAVLHLLLLSSCNKHSVRLTCCVEVEPRLHSRYEPCFFFTIFTITIITHCNLKHVLDELLLLSIVAF